MLVSENTIAKHYLTVLRSLYTYFIRKFFVLYIYNETYIIKNVLFVNVFEIYIMRDQMLKKKS